jgi:hypothetical protein
MDRVAAIKKIATDFVLPVDTAVALLEKAASDGKAVAWVASAQQLAYAQLAFNKQAADDGGGEKKEKSEKSDKPKPKKPPGESAPSGGPPGAPGDDAGLGAEAAQAVMGAPPAPPPPTPLDLAAMEMDQAIQHEMQKLMERQQTIQMLQQRSNEIAGGAPPAASVQTQAMGAPPSSMNLATGGPSMGGMGAPPMGGDPSMMGGGGGAPQMGGMGGDPSMMSGGGAPPMGGDPSMMGGAPPMGGMPGGDPSMMGGAPPMGGMPGGDPSMMGGMGGDPSMMGGGMPPSAMMPPDGPNVGSLQSEINPHFMEQAAQLHSADAFDAAAVATLAQSPALHAVVGQYLPNLEKSVDNLARVLLTLWMQESDLKERVGEETFDGLEQSLQTSFKGMGELVLRLARGVQGAKDPEAHAAT